MFCPICSVVGRVSCYFGTLVKRPTQREGLLVELKQHFKKAASLISSSSVELDVTELSNYALLVSWQALSVVCTIIVSISCVSL